MIEPHGHATRNPPAVGATATAVITGGTSDVIAIDTGTNTFVFADTNGDNVLDTVIQLTGTGLGLAFGDFVA